MVVPYNNKKNQYESAAVVHKPQMDEEKCKERGNERRSSEQKGGGKNLDEEMRTPVYCLLKWLILSSGSTLSQREISPYISVVNELQFDHRVIGYGLFPFLPLVVRLKKNCDGFTCDIVLFCTDNGYFFFLDVTEDY